MRYDIGGIELNVVEEGAGHPIIFLHGIGGSWRDWIPQLDTLSDRYRCIAIDQRGFGRSDRPPGPVSFDEYADDVARLCTTLELDHIYLVGLSMGGMIAQATALRHPDLVDAAVFADTACWSDPSLLETVKSSAELMRTQPQSLGMLIDVYKDVTWSAASRDQRPHLVTDFRREFASNDPDAFAAALEMIGGLDNREALRGLKPPALVLWGEHDGLTTREQADVLVASLPAGKLSVVEGAGHMSNLEEPEAFNAAVTSFFDAHPCSR